MPSLCGGPDFRLIDLDAESRPPGPIDEAGAVMEHGGIHQVVQKVAPLVVMNAEALLLDEGIRSAEVDLQGGSETDRAEWAVRCDGYIVSLGHGGDLLQLGNAAAMAHVGLDDIGAAGGEEMFEAPPRELAFPGRDRDGTVRAQVEECFVIFREHWFFDEERF